MFSHEHYESLNFEETTQLTPLSASTLFFCVFKVAGNPAPFKMKNGFLIVSRNMLKSFTLQSISLKCFLPYFLTRLNDANATMWWLAELAVVKRSTLYLIIIEAGFGVCFCLMAKSEALGLNKDGVFLGRW